MPKKSWEIRDGVIPDDLREIMREIADSIYVFEAGMLHAPPWKRYPGYKQSSMRWRMGGGEDYMSGFRKWYSSLSAQEREHYRSLNPAPPDWESFYERMDSHGDK